MTYLFRDATPADLAAIVAIYNATVPSRMVTADLEPVSVASRQAWFDAHSPDHRPLWVVEASEDPGAGILGWLSFSDFYGRPAYSATVEVSIYLAEAAAAPALAIHNVLGFIFGHNEASRGLFRAHGFADWGVLPAVASLDGVERDLVIMGRRL